ncbi:hypothetical protein B566_EDAN006322 [Ephemera danica]|nr:hypothetical protein B566_EDAN006322 [Ephemera danica]
MPPDTMQSVAAVCKHLLLGCCVLLTLTSRWHHCADATFSFSSFTSGASSKPMAALGSSLQQYLSSFPMARIMGGEPAPAASSHSPGYLLPASATVGIGTILPPLVKAVPYGPPRPVSRPRPMHRMPPLRGPKFPPIKSSYYGPPKHKLQHVNSLPLHDKELMRPTMEQAQQQHYYQQSYTGYNEAPQHYESHYKTNDDYLGSHPPQYPSLPTEMDYTRSEILHSSYAASATNSEEPSASNRAPVIVYQGVRPPVRYYQEPQHAAPPPAALPASSTYERSDTQLDYSRPDPGFSALQNSDWKPINAPVGAVPARGYAMAAPDLSRRADSSKQVAPHVAAAAVAAPPPPTLPELPHPVYSGPVDRSDQEAEQEEPSEEVVSAVVFVKQ